MDDAAQVRVALRQASVGHLVTHGAGDGRAFTSTPLPFVIDDDLGVVRAHVARANPHWRLIDGAAALLIVTSADAYISPRWYQSKAEHGRVVPTWNYEVVHVHGRVAVHHDTDWKRAMVGDLTDHHEAHLPAGDGSDAWEVADAPAEFIDAQLKSIVGIELTVLAVDAKQKLSQNKPEGDRAGAAAGLAGTGRPADAEVADRMRRASER